ncbi:MAG TPA: type II toxin-antitoxin system prevent-host-death family antitoxin [Thermoanaerobaculia bacterium]
MQSAVKIDIMIPKSRRVEIELPEDLPLGPAEIIVLAGPERSIQRELRPIGIDVGKGRIAEDFDAPLPDEILDLFEGRS